MTTSPLRYSVGQMESVRKIIHVDMDAFYASVEQLDHPELRGKPVIVGGDPKSRGVVASASYEARKFGVRSAISCAQAKRLCPSGKFVYPNFKRYHEVSEQIHEVFREVTDLVEPLSLDEAYLDVTENHLNEPLARKIAVHIKKKIREETGLTASAGVGPNKFIAKLASDHRKPNGLVVVPPARVMEFIYRLPVEKFWGVGPATAEILHQYGFRTAEDIRNSDLASLQRAVGSYAQFLYDLAHGRDDREVDPTSEPKSRGAETTFAKDIVSTDTLLQALHELSDEVASDLKTMGRPGRTVTLKLRYSDFKTITRSKTIGRATDERDTIAQTASHLLLEATEVGKRPVRLIGVSVSSLVHPEEPYQLWLDLHPL